jgi:transcriptional regulator with XRE-family HTH domain
LSEAAGMSRGAVGLLEAERGLPLLSTAEKLANALQVSPGWLVYGLDSPWEPAEQLRCKGLAARLRQLRDELGLSLAEVGKYAGSSGAAVLAVERGTLPTIASLENLATALGVSPAWLAFGLGPRELPRRGSRPSVVLM